METRRYGVKDGGVCFKKGKVHKGCKVHRLRRFRNVNIGNG